MHLNVSTFQFAAVVLGLILLPVTTSAQNNGGQFNGTQNQGLQNQGLQNRGFQNGGVQQNGSQNRQLQGSRNLQQGTGGGANNQNINNGFGSTPLPDVRKSANQVLPRPFPELSERHIQYLDQLLNYWETNSDKIKRYQCKFTNWTYNSMQVPIKDPASQHVFAQTISTGTVKFASPDKGLFDSNKVWTFDKQRYAEKKDPFKEAPELRQKWHCDGKAIYEYLYTRKELIETPIPKEMQGERIVDGPLPFLFGAKSAELKRRYWIRCITPKDRGEKGEYWLEAYPKYRRDAANFQKVEIILENKDFLPAVLTLFSPEHDLKTGRIISKQTIKFDNRKIWENAKAPGLAQFFDELSKRPSTPFGWKRSNTQIRDTSPRVGSKPQGPRK